MTHLILFTLISMDLSNFTTPDFVSICVGIGTDFSFLYGKYDHENFIDLVTTFGEYTGEKDANINDVEVEGIGNWKFLATVKYWVKCMKDTAVDGKKETYIGEGLYIKLV